MSAINFQIQNPNATPANAPVLYLGQANTLQVVFSNSIGIPCLEPKDVITVIIPKTLIASADVSQLDDPDWSLIITGQETQSTGFNYMLSPKKSLPFSGTLTITLINLHGITLSNDDVSTNYKVSGKPFPGSTQKLFVQNPPNQPGDLRDVITFDLMINDDQNEIPNGKVYISPVNPANNAISPVIFNQLHLNLKFDQNAGNLTDKWDPKNPPTFILSFSYGSGGSDLTDDQAQTLPDPPKPNPNYNPITTARNIVSSISPDENNRWNLIAPDQNSPAAHSWTVQPTLSNQQIFSDSNPNLDVLFSHVVSILPAGNATMYIQWSGIPGYNDGITALNLEKVNPKPQILSFSGTGGNLQESVAFNQQIPLFWKTFGASALKLSWHTEFHPAIILQVPVTGDANGLLNSGSLTQATTPVSPVSEFYLTALDVHGNSSNQAGPVEIDVPDFKSPVISQFSGTVEHDTVKGYFFLHLQWLVTDAVSNSYCTLNGNPTQYPTDDGKGGVYKHVIPLSASIPLQPSYTLYAIDPYADQKVEQTIQIIVPPGLQPTISLNVTVNGQVLEFAWLAKNIGADGHCLFNGGSQHLPGHSANGQPYTTQLPFSVANSMHHTFELQAFNVALNLNTASTVTIPWKDTLLSDEILGANEFIRSANGQYSLYMQGDSNLVLYESGGVPFWASNTVNTGAINCIMQGDGNFVIYKPGGVPVWATGTNGTPGAVLVMQNDKNLVIYKPGGIPIWATGTN